MAKYFYLNGSIIPKEEAKIDLGDIGITRGYGIFDYFQVKQGKPLFMHEHLDRFINSSQYLRLQVSETKEDLIRHVHELISVNEVEYAGFKVVATGGVSSDGVSIGKASVGIQVLPFSEPSEELIHSGVKLLSYEYQRLLPHIKSTSYLYNVYLSPELKAAGALEPLYYTQESVRETARANIFAVINGTLITCKDKMLAGINREKTINSGYPVELRNITLEELKNADEVFLTGTTKRAIAVTQIDDAVIGDGKPGTITMDIRNLLLDKERLILEC